MGRADTPYMPVQINIFGEEEFIEPLIDPKQFCQKAQDHIRLLRNLTLQISIIDRLDGISPEEQRYIKYLRQKMVTYLESV